MEALKTKKLDVGVGVAVSSLVYQRYDQFAEPLRDELVSLLEIPKEDDKDVRLTFDYVVYSHRLSRRFALL